MTDDLPETIKRPDTFNRAAPAGYDGVFDWTWTQGCFGDTKIKPMDVDAIVERKGQFLVFETKNIGVPIPAGQMFTLEALHRLDVFTILIIYGKLYPETCDIWYPKCSKVGKLEGTEAAHEFVCKWFAWADNR